MEKYMVSLTQKKAYGIIYNNAIMDKYFALDGR